MTPILPHNSWTITPRQWPLNTPEEIEERLTHLRRMDSLFRETSELREMEKQSLYQKLERLKEKGNGR